MLLFLAGSARGAFIFSFAQSGSDVVATGTPTGVGMGRGFYLNPGDTISATIAGIGTLTNQVSAEMI